MSKILKTHTIYMPFFGKGIADTRVGVMAVLAEDLTGQYAVYVGAVPDTIGSDMDAYDRAADRIMGSGAKQTFRDAGLYFRGLEDAKYRR